MCVLSNFIFSFQTFPRLEFLGTAFVALFVVVVLQVSYNCCHFNFLLENILQNYHLVTRVEHDRPGDRSAE